MSDPCPSKGCALAGVVPRGLQCRCAVRVDPELLRDGPGAEVTAGSFLHLPPLLAVLAPLL
eukprot:5373223-Alexandrium_andersonii.AAC.1